MPKDSEKLADATRYPIEVFHSEEDGGFIAIAKDLPGCSAFGKTQAEALAEIQDAIKAWQCAAEVAGNPVPPPSVHADEPLPSGKLLLRIPRSLHASLIECAKKESVSLNQHLVSVLSLSVGVTLLREARNILGSMQAIVPNTGVGAAFPCAPVVLPRTANVAVSYFHVGGARVANTQATAVALAQTWQIVEAGTETVLRPYEQLDVRALPANVPVILAEGLPSWPK
jgi:predicted RNase H-like HicB family nuclease